LIEATSVHTGCVALRCGTVTQRIRCERTFRKILAMCLYARVIAGF